MFFNSLHYAIFLPLVVAFYFLIPPQRRWMFMLAASYYFYMCWKVEYIFLIVISTLIDYYVGLAMGRTADQTRRKRLLAASLCSNLGILFAFKYFNFFNESARATFERFDLTYNIPYFDVLLPVGISFYTFQTLSYTIEVYRGHQEPESHLGIFALYVSFFPQLVAGPIERSTHLLPQFYNEVSFSYRNSVDGLKLVVWGLFKKVVIADRIGVMVATIFNNPREYSGVEFILGSALFAYQVYCDFSGYSDIAIGTAQIFGIKLMTNFRRPFHAISLGDLWSRWHISLTTWFRDYLYIPLGGSRKGKYRTYFNVFTIFLVSGLWHGAAWTYVIWGAVHGVFMSLELWTAQARVRIFSFLRMPPSNFVYRTLGLLYTMTVFNFALLIFRALNVRDAFYMVGHLFDGVLPFLGRILSGDTIVIRGMLRSLGLSQKELTIAIAAILILEFAQILQRRESLRAQLGRRPAAVRWVVYYGLVIAIVFFGAFNMSQQFIYFQF
ncbi:MAG: MBOAT family protein [Candidatus Krumholzibacteriia bacterium]